MDADKIVYRSQLHIGHIFKIRHTCRREYCFDRDFQFRSFPLCYAKTAMIAFHGEMSLNIKFHIQYPLCQFHYKIYGVFKEEISLM
jgi:hypothetical protein